MNTYKTFMGGSYVGRCTLSEIKKWEAESREIAKEIQKQHNPDHIIYAYYEYNSKDEIETAYIQILEKTDAEFERISNIPNYRICAFHKH